MCSDQARCFGVEPRHKEDHLHVSEVLAKRYEMTINEDVLFAWLKEKNTGRGMVKLKVLSEDVLSMGLSFYEFNQALKGLISQGKVEITGKLAQGFCLKC